MNVLSAIEQRRAIKKFDPGHHLSLQEIEELIRFAMLAPTAWNIQHWRFVSVTDMAIRQQLREAAWDQAQITDASALIIITADLMAWNKCPERYWRNAAPERQSYLLNGLKQFYEGNSQLQRDEAMRSCGMAAMALMLAAQECGYDSCPMVGFDRDRVAHIIQLPEDHVIAMLIAIGRKTQDAGPRGGQLAISDVLIDNRFPP